jgi:transmembrane sensor
MDKTQQIEEIAGRWLLKRESPEWCATKQAELDAWLEASTSHLVAYLRLEAAWRETGRLKALSAGVPKGTVPDPERWQLGLVYRERPVRRLRTRHWGVLAASVLLALASAGWWMLKPYGSTYQTPIGGTASVPMQDGSAVTLNTDTKIRVAMSEQAREVNLERGEAFFEVAKDPKRPFVVTASRKRVIAVGTQFSVERQGDQVRVRVSEGTVRLEDVVRPLAERRSRFPAVGSAVPDQTASTPPEGLSGAGVLLPAGSIARANGDNLLLEKETLPELEEDLSWRQGYLVFRDVPLSQAAEEFNRYSTRPIVIDDPSIAAIRVSGKFRATNADAFVRLIEDGFPVNARGRDQAIVLSHR